MLKVPLKVSRAIVPFTLLNEGMWFSLSTDRLLITLYPKVFEENSPRIANVTSDFATELSTAMPIGGTLCIIFSAAVGVVLNAPIMQTRTSRCIRSDIFLYDILLASLRKIGLAVAV